MLSITNTLFWGKVLTRLSSVDSTNNYAKSLLTKSKPTNGTVIIADEQHAGRGQIGNKWETEAGLNLTFTVILYPTFLSVTEQFGLNIAVSLGIVSFLKQLLPDNLVQIKWPNDILVDGKKIAGILIENSLQGSNINHSIVGIGLNINQIEFPNKIIATSTKLVSGKEFDLEMLLPELIHVLEGRYLTLMSDVRNELHENYLENLYGYRQKLPFKVGNEEKEGLIDGIDSSGRLKVMFGETVRYYNFKEIEFIL